MPRDVWTPGVATTFYDDFSKSSLLSAATTVNIDGWYPYIEAGGTFVDGAEAGSTIVITEATNNESIGIRQSYPGFQIDTTNALKLAFECRFKVSSIAANVGGIFIGLFDATALTTLIPITATADTLSAHNFIGFNLLESDGSSITTTYQADGGAVQATTGQYTLVAATYKKVGFYFDGDALTWYDNGIKLAAGNLTRDDIGAAADPATFPNDVMLGPCISMKQGATARTIEVDWIACAQLKDS